MKFTDDLYKQNRGGYSRLYTITCRKCGDVICQYQKDGPGNLRRLYIDRMIGNNLQGKELSCRQGHVIGVKILHTEHKEKRYAYRLFVDAIVKKLISSEKFAHR